MANGNLIRGLLDLNILVGNELGLLDLQVKLSFDVVLHAFHTWALNHWGKFFGMNNLVDFVTASLAGVDGHLHAGFDI